MSYGCAAADVIITQDGCIVPERGRVEWIAGVKNGFELADPSNPVEWAALFAAGNAFKIQGAGDKPRSAPVTAEGVGSQETRNVGRNFTLNFVLDDYEANIEEFIELNTSTSYRLYYTSERNVWDAGVVANWDFDTNIQRSLSTLVRGEMLITWSGTRIGTPYTRPMAIFS